jgi:O-antigen ligase/tetratricopeptide (TPR) repeat protein
MNTTIKNTLKWAVISGLFAVPFIPFIISRSLLFPFITGKGFTFRILIEILFGLWLLLALADPDFRPKWNYITKSIVVFVGIVFLADLFSKYPFKSFWSNYERMEGFVTIIHLAMFYFVVSSMFKAPKWWTWFWNTELVAGLIMAVYGFFQLAGKIAVDQGGVRLDGTLGNASYLAIYAVFNMFIALMMFYKTPQKVWKWVYGILFIAQGIVLYYTATRGAILGFIGGIILTALIIAWKERQNTTMRKVAAYLIGIVVVLALLFVAFRNSNFVKTSPVLSRFTEFSFNDSENIGRTDVWNMAIKGAEERPILGWGQESFNYVFNTFYNPNMYAQEQWFDRTHNIVLDWLINAGVLGLLAYTSLFVALLYMLWKKTHITMEEKAMITGLMAAYVFNNMFVFDNLVSYILFFLFLAYVSSQSETLLTAKSPMHIKTETLNYLATPVIVIAIVACVYFVNIPALKASTTLIQAISNQSSPQVNLDDFTKVFSYNSFGSPEALEQLISVSGQVIGTQSVDASVKQGFFSLADTQIKAQVSKTPQDARYLLLGGSFYNQVGQYDTAIPLLNNAIKYSPGKPAMYFELATSYLGKGNADQAFQLFTQGYNLATSAPDSQIVYAVGALYDNKPAIVQQMFAIIGQDTIISDDRILQAYVNLKDYTSAEAILGLRLQKTPTDYNSEFELASVYATSGQTAKAIQVLQDIETRNPSLKAQVDPYITQLQTGK